MKRGYWNCKMILFMDWVLEFGQRDAHQIHRVSRAIQAGRIWVNCYHVYPAHAFCGYKKSGIGKRGLIWWC